MQKRLLVLFAVAGLAVVATAVASTERNRSVHLKGRFEVPLRDTDAQGQAIFHVADDGQSADYKLIVANIDNAFMAHIHIGPRTGTGPIAVWLYPSTTPNMPAPTGQGRVDGVIAEGTITAANFIGPLAGKPFSALLDAFANETAYVNVHTDDGVAPPNTGPGDFPGGEIRGQVD